MGLVGGGQLHHHAAARQILLELNMLTGADQETPESRERHSLPWELVSKTVEVPRSATALAPPLGSPSEPGTRVRAPHELPPSSERL